MPAELHGCSNERYAGLWQRRSLRTPDGLTDTSTRVYWLQTRLLYADIRIPADRPTCAGRASLADCSDGELQALARQQGFAGVLESGGEFCLWHRHIDYQLPTYAVDAGRMLLEAEDLAIEAGICADYGEDWQRIAPASAGRLAMKVYVEDAATPPCRLRQGVLVAAGDYFIFAMERRSPPGDLPPGAALGEIRDRDILMALLDCEISFGVRRSGVVPWQICLSTLPFREGRSLLEGDADAPGIVSPLLAGRRITWVTFEQTPDFTWK